MPFESVPVQGTIAGWLTPPHPSAFSDALPCRWPDLESGNISVSVVKTPDATVTVTMHGLHARPFVFTAAIPTCDARGLHVAIRWTNLAVDLFLNGQRSKSID